MKILKEYIEFFKWLIPKKVELLGMFKFYFVPTSSVVLLFVVILMVLKENVLENIPFLIVMSSIIGIPLSLAYALLKK